MEAPARGASKRVRPGGVVAFAVPDARGETEAVALVVELREARFDEATARSVAARVRAQRLAAHGVEPGQRGDRVGRGVGTERVEALGALPPHERLEAAVVVLQDEVARSTGLGDGAALDPGRSLAAYGLDSMALVDLADRLSEAVDRPVSMARLARLGSLRAVARHLLADVLGLTFVAAGQGGEAPEEPAS